MFVTWKIGDRLRGCIGTFSAVPLQSGLRDYALTSAFKDSRFDPVEFEEVPSMCCSVSLLHAFEDVSTPYEWDVGVHGIIINFVDAKGRSYRATYLPEVAQEQGWSKLECLQSLVRKAGFKGTVSKDVISSLSVTRYQSSKAALSYPAYQALVKAKTDTK
eukprot:c1478_g1_i2.p1 GENE.c1478_g1_i2~~c1478_g1_i2.p1  ORF type:complete len:160 (+),score=31.95 c1478_g1_i2:198-677(+)